MFVSIAFDKWTIFAHTILVFDGAAAARVAAGAPPNVGVLLEKVDRVHGLDGAATTDDVWPPPVCGTR
jgi:hypothetical protein